ncbi:hypothetical protein WKW50_24405, partial [Ochrobactrum sp. GPK 3]
GPMPQRTISKPWPENSAYQKVAETIKSGGAWPTVIGQISYDAKGDITRPDYVVYEWTKGENGKPTYGEK